MSDSEKIEIGISSRRAFLAGVGAVAGLAMARTDSWFGSTVSDLSFESAFLTFEQSLSSIQREHTFLSIDDPMRQITKTEAVHTGPHIGTLYNHHQIALIRQMYSKMVSDQGRDWLHNTISLEGRFEGSTFKIYSDLSRQASLNNSQVVINGGHYLLRSDDVQRSGYALGGPVSYGQQLGDRQYKVQGNAFKAHGDAVDQFHQSLNAEQCLRAYQIEPPQELVTQVQGPDAVYPGLRIGDVSGASKEIARDMITTLLAGYSGPQGREAWSVIEDNGGLDSLHLALYSDFGFYADGTRYNDLDNKERASKGRPYIQVWRIEGPASVMHFKGYPHVHAYMNFVKDPSKIAIGETLSHTQEVIGIEGVRKMMNSVLKQKTGQEFAYYPDLVQGRLSPGIISTGSIYTLDPFNNRMVVAEVLPQAMSDDLKLSLTQQGAELKPGQPYKVATIDYSLVRADLFGEVERIEYSNQTMRSALVDFVRGKQPRDFLA